MKTIRGFEDELIKRYDIEPKNEGYSIEELKEDDRNFLSGMLYVLHKTIDTWQTECEEKNSAFGDGFKKALDGYVKEARDLLVEELKMDIERFIISTLDGYEEEGGE